MATIFPQFKDDTDKVITVIMLVASIFMIFIPSLIVVLFVKDYVSESSYKIAKSIFNMELLFFLISLIFAIPIIGWIIGFIIAPILEIINVVVIILALCAIAKQNEIKIPVMFEFM